MKLLPCLMTLSLGACGPADKTSSATDGASSTSSTSDGGGTTSTTGPTGTATTVSVTTGVVPVCECPAEDCAGTVCGLVYMQCFGPCTPAGLDDEVALQCTLEALRDRKPGGLEWLLSEEGGVVEQHVDLWILDDGTAYVRRAASMDFDSSIGPDGYYALQDPAYFDACLIESDAAVRFECMRNGVGEQLQECVPYQGFPGPSR